MAEAETYRSGDVRSQVARWVIVLAWVVQMTWGLAQNAIGLIMALGLRGRSRQSIHRTALVTEWRLKSGLSLGAFIFVPRECTRALVAHEYGHTLQSLILGPLYLPAIVVPSLVWAGAPALRRYRSNHQYSYYRFYCERWANHLSARIGGELPEGWRPRR